MKKNVSKTGFTLIELLVVIAIIGLLAGLLFPAVTSSLNTAKKTKAKATAQNIETAIMVYFNEYNGRLPIPMPYGSDDVITADESISKDILVVLMSLDKGSNSGYKLNPKRIVFLETDVPTDDGTYLDPWGTQYKILLDRNLDGKIEYLTKSGEAHRKKAIVVSAGKNKLFGSGTAKDTSGEKDNNDNVANVALPLLY